MFKFFLILSLFLFKCAHNPHHEFNSLLEKKNCEDSFVHIPELQASQRVVKNADWAAKNTLAYTYIGLNYTAEVVWDVSVGAVGVIVLCAPFVALMAASSASGNPSGMIGAPCFPPPEFSKILLSPPLGKKSFLATEALRCPNVEPLVLSLEKVAHCYEDRNGTNDAEKALKTMDSIIYSQHFFSCASLQTQKRIEEKQTLLKNKINL